MEYYEVMYVQTTTDGKEIITISTGEGTGDVDYIVNENDAILYLAEQMDNFIEQQLY